MTWDLPSIVFGTSSFGNQYEELPYEQKLSMAKTWFESVPGRVVLDTAGKYGAGLSLEMMGRVLRDLQIDPERVVISNKLAWKRVPLTSAEPTFEPGGTWVNIDHDAEQCISYEGILECHQQGCELLGEPYRPKLLSVHDPDEYLAKAKTSSEREERMNHIVEGYRALEELKAKGEIEGIGVGSKDWRVIPEIYEKVSLDWVMLACSLTPYQHDLELLSFIGQLHQEGVSVVNSAVFNAGFLLGGEFFDYRIPKIGEEPELFKWRERFLELCQNQGWSASDVCIQFGMSLPGIKATALNSSKPERIIEHIEAVKGKLPQPVLNSLYEHGLIQAEPSSFCS